MRIRVFSLAILSVAASLLTAPASKGAPPRPEFDAASLKPDNGPFVPDVSGTSKGGPGTDDPGRFTYTQQRLKFILTFAYDLAPDQLSVPSWMDDAQDKFTIVATMPRETSKEQFHLMLQNLLTERFHLAMHHETREFPGYDLVLASGGQKFKEWTPDPNADPNAPGAGRDQSGFPRLAPNKPGSAVSFMMANGAASPSIVRLSARQSMADFAKRMGALVNASNGMPAGVAQPRVADKTGLPKVYEFKLEFQGTPLMSGAPPPPSGANAPAATDPGGPNLFTALEKQLGLKLVKAKNVPVDVLVIDRSDKSPGNN